MEINSAELKIIFLGMNLIDSTKFEEAKTKAEQEGISLMEYLPKDISHLFESLTF